MDVEQGGPVDLVLRASLENVAIGQNPPHVGLHERGLPVRVVKYDGLPTSGINPATHLEVDI
jgi:hypothetical protein